MGEPRKVFRIEEMAVPRRAPEADDAPSAQLAEILHQLGTLRALLVAPPPRQTAAANAVRPDAVERLAARLRLIRSTILGAAPDGTGMDVSRRPSAPRTRIAGELEAVMQGSEQATQKILAAAEEIDQAANTLSAALKGDAEQGLAQDIRDRVIAIFEACNYQDLISQRVAKVMAALGLIESQIAGTLMELGRDAAPPLHGPRLPDDRGHVSQSEVDAMFGGPAAKSA